MALTQQIIAVILPHIKPLKLWFYCSKVKNIIGKMKTTSLLNISAANIIISEKKYSSGTNSRRHQRKCWTWDQRTRLTFLQKASWQRRSLQTEWGCGWSSQLQSRLKTRGPGSAAGGSDLARSDRREAWRRWRHWRLTLGSSLSDTSWWGLCLLCF